MIKSKTIGAVLLLIVTTLFFFYPAIYNGFVKWDDPLLITENKEIQNPSIAYISRIFTFEYAIKIHHYHPLVSLLFMMEYHFFGLQAAGFHGINILVHCLNTLLIFWFILLLSRRISWSLSTALLFSLHPIHVQSVVWVTELKDLLYSFFFLAALISYWKYLQNKKQFTYLLCFIFGLFSALAKSMAVTLPLLFLLMDYYKEKELKINKIIEKIPFFLISAFLFSINSYIVAGNKNNELFNINFNLGEKIKSGLYGILFLIHQAFIPLRLSPHYPDYFNSPYHFFSFFWLPGILLIAITIYFVIIQGYQREVRFGLLFFWIGMLPILGLLFLGYPPYDHYLYMAILGLIFAFVSFTGKWLERRDPRHSIYKKTALVTLLLVATLFGLLSRQITAIWKDDLTLWNAAIHNYPTHIAFLNRGVHFFQMGKSKNALDDFNSALKINPNYTLALINRGILYLLIKQFQLADQDFLHAIKTDSHAASALYYLSLSFIQQQRFPQALKLLNKVIQLSPLWVEARYNRGLLFLSGGWRDRAEKDLIVAISQRPNFLPAQEKLMEIYIESKNDQQAENICHRILIIDPRNQKALDYLKNRQK